MKKTLFVCCRPLVCGVLVMLLSMLGCGSSSSKPAHVPIVNSPSMSLSEGTYSNSQYVSITCSTEGALIRYTVDGSTPSANYGIQSFGTPIEIKNTQTIKAVAYKSGWTPSSVIEKKYTILSTVANPSLSLSGGAYRDAQKIKLYCGTPGAKIRYTLEDDDPDPSPTSGTIYVSGTEIAIPKKSDEITVSRIRAVAYCDETSFSSVVEATYTITGQVAAPVFEPALMQHEKSFSFTLSDVTSGAVIYYTTDGNDPSRSYGKKYTAPVLVEGSCVIRACAYVPAWGVDSDSAVAAQAYNVSNQVSQPEIAPSSGAYYNPVTISMSSATANAVIWYTLDGSTPEAGVTGYQYDAGNPPVLSEMGEHRVRAYAIKSGCPSSAIVEVDYTITGTVPDPVFDKTEGYYADPQTVTIQCDMDDAQLRYTFDESIDPSDLDASGCYVAEPGAELTVVIPEKTSRVIKVCAVHTGWKTSAVVSRRFTITGKMPSVIITPMSGNSLNPQVVTMTLPDLGSLSGLVNASDIKIRYTEGEDGKVPDPTATTGTLYSGPFMVGRFSNYTVKAIAYIPGFDRSSDSEVTVREYSGMRVVSCVGNIVSSSGSSATLWFGGKLVPLGKAGAQSTYVENMCVLPDETLVAAGYYLDAGGTSHACYWSVSGETVSEFDLATSDDAYNSAATGAFYNSISGNVYFTGYEPVVFSDPIYDGSGHVIGSNTVVKRGACFWLNEKCHGECQGKDKIGPHSSTEPDTVMDMYFMSTYAGSCYYGSHVGQLSSWWGIPRMSTGNSLYDPERSYDSVKTSDLGTPSIVSDGFEYNVPSNGITSERRYIFLFGYQIEGTTTQRASIWRYGWQQAYNNSIQIPDTDPVQYYLIAYWDRFYDRDRVVLNQASNISSLSATVRNGTVFYSSGSRILPNGKFVACYWKSDLTIPETPVITTRDLYETSDYTAIHNDSSAQGVSLYKMNGTVFCAGYKIVGSVKKPVLWVDESGNARSEIELIGADNFQIKSVYVKQ